MSSSPPLFPPLSPTFPSFPAINSQFTVSADGVGMFNVSSLLVFSVLNIPSSLRPCLSLNILHQNSPSIRRPPPRCTSHSFVFHFFLFFFLVQESFGFKLLSSRDEAVPFFITPSCLPYFDFLLYCPSLHQLSPYWRSWIAHRYAV